MAPLEQLLGEPNSKANVPARDKVSLPEKPSSGLSKAPSTQSEEQLLQRAAKAETAARSAVERWSRSIAEQRAELESQIAAIEEELQSDKEAAMEIQGKVALQRHEGCRKASDLAALLPEVEQAAEDVRSTDKAAAELRSRIAEDARLEREYLAQARSIYQLYAASTGIRWDTQSKHVEGCIAIHSARHFDLVGNRQDIADALWDEIEAAHSAQPASGSATVSPLFDALHS